MSNLKGKVVIVTGASRGIGKGIALGLAEQGATIYVTGRTEDGKNLPEYIKDTTIYHTAEEINRRGGIGISHRCDHSKDDEIEQLFERVLKEQGRLDVLVNNAWGAGKHILGGYFFNTPFWEQPITLFDDDLTVGLRSNYVASRLAAKQMMGQKDGLIVNISYYGGRRYFNNVSYGVCKAAIDKLSADIAHELKPFNVKAISLYPGTVKTEGMVELSKYDSTINLEDMESLEFAGKCIGALALDEQLINDTGKIFITAEVAQKYGFKDSNGKQPRSQREMLWQ